MPIQPHICTSFFHAEDKKEAAGSPEILVPICQTAPYQMNRIIVLILMAMTTSTLIFEKLPNKELKEKRILWGVMLCSLIKIQNFTATYCWHLQHQVPPKCQ